MGLHMRSRGITPQCPIFLYKVDTFRAVWGASLYVNRGEHRLRGFRHTKEQLKLYSGAPEYTFHYWCAADFVPVDADQDAVLWELFYAAVNYTWGGAYLNLDKRFVHVDNRPYPYWYAVKESGKLTNWKGDTNVKLAERKNN